MLGLSLGREYRDPTDSAPAIATQRVIDTEGSSCATPTYSFAFNEFTSSDISSLSFPSTSFDIPHSSGSTLSILSGKNVTGATIVDFQGEENVLRIELGNPYPHPDCLNAVRASIIMVLRMRENGNDVLESNVLRPDWSHHVRLKYWVEINPYDHPFNEADTIESGGVGYGFGHMNGFNVLTVLDAFKPNTILDGKPERWYDIELDIFDQQDNSGNYLLDDINGPNDDGPTAALIGQVSHGSTNSDQVAYTEEGSYKPSALYIASCSYSICPRT